MARIECVARALRALGKTCHSPVGAQRIKPVLPAREKLVCIGLVADIPDDPVIREIQCQMKSHGQFHRAEIAGKMSSGHTDLFDKKIPDLLRQKRILLLRDLFYVSALIYAVKKLTHVNLL